MNTRPDADPVKQNSPPDIKMLDKLVGDWNEEHADLTDRTEKIHHWLAEVSQRGIPRFGELATRLKNFRERLLDHFQREEDLGKQLQEACDWVEMATSRQQIASDHQHLIRRLDSLIARLRELEPPFDTFQQAIDEVGLFVDAFELHEEHETQCLQWLTARPLDFRKLPR